MAGPGVGLALLFEVHAHRPLIFERLEAHDEDHVPRPDTFIIPEAKV